jgi:hypothetical protein
MVELMPKKAFSLIRILASTFTPLDIKVPSYKIVCCAIWLPILMITKSFIITYGIMITPGKI